MDKGNCVYYINRGIMNMCIYVYVWLMYVKRCSGICKVYIFNGGIWIFFIFVCFICGGICIVLYIVLFKCFM